MNEDIPKVFCLSDVFYVALIMLLYMCDGVHLHLFSAPGAQLCPRV